MLRTTAGTYSSERVSVRTHKMTDLSGITITTGILPPAARESLAKAVERIGAKMTDTVRIDTTHFVTTEGRGIAWEKAVESNIPVVRPEWVEACEKTGRILGVTKYYLDAMRPGPSETPVAQAPTQRQVQKELPRTPEKAEEKTEEKSEDKKNEAAGEKESDKEEKNGEREEGEQKVITEEPEQKMRVEEKESQKVALRPAPAENKSSDGEDEGGGSAKVGTSPDGASFQEVEL